MGSSDPVIRSPARYRWTTAPARIVRWNEDRVSASVQGQKVGGLRTYNTKLHFAANELSNKVYGRPLHVNVHHPGVFTGELLSVQYCTTRLASRSPVDLENEVAEDHFEEDQDEDLEDVTYRLSPMQHLA